MISFEDVVRGICEKMTRRHPHVFGDEKARAAGGFWEDAKAREKAACGGEPESAVDGVPLPLPALTRAVKLQAKAARVGFEKRIFEECGDLLFVHANLARHPDVDPEAALRAANHKFTRRFRAVEDKLHNRGGTPADSDLAEMDALRDEAKGEEKAEGKEG